MLGRSFYHTNKSLVKYSSATLYSLVYIEIKNSKVFLRSQGIELQRVHRYLLCNVWKEKVPRLCSSSPVIFTECKTLFCKINFSPLQNCILTPLILANWIYPRYKDQREHKWQLTQFKSLSDLLQISPALSGSFQARHSTKWWFTASSIK